MVQGINREDSLPEGLQRERKGPYDKDVGRKEEAARVPGNRKREKDAIAFNNRDTESLIFQISGIGDAGLEPAIPSAPLRW